MPTVSRVEYTFLNLRPALCDEDNGYDVDQGDVGNNGFNVCILKIVIMTT